MLTHHVTIWSIRHRKTRAKPYQLRWKTGTDAHSKAFLTRALAEDYRADLLKAAKRGELFDLATGLPESMLRADKEPVQRSWFDFARTYVADRWKDDAAKTRASLVDSLVTATLALRQGEAADLSPQVVRAAMNWALVPRADDAQPPKDLSVDLQVLRKGTLAVADLADRRIAEQVFAVLGSKLDGSLASTDTASRRRRAFNTAIKRAVRLGELEHNPFAEIREDDRRRKRVSRDDAVDRRVVVNPRQARDLLTALSYVGSWHRGRGRRLVAFFATLYFAGVRPAEAVGLREAHCSLPTVACSDCQEHARDVCDTCGGAGTLATWGLLTLTETRPSGSKKFTDSGDVHDRRGLKQRDRRAAREVPIPPVLVEVLRAHVGEFGTAPDGRIFRNERGGVLGSSTYSRAWEEARHLALTPRQARSPLAGRPYDLRHAALSTWLNGGVDPTDVAERAGNSVEVLLKRYAKCLDGRRERNNRLIERAVDGSDAE